MKRLAIILLILTSIALPVAAQTRGNTKDQEAINSIAIKWQDYWNRNDMKALARLVAENVDFITVGGSRHRSREEFEVYHAKLHVTQMKDSVLTIKNTEINFIRSDIALAHVEWGMKGDKNVDGTSREPREGIMTWVLEKRKGNWTLIASQNTNLRVPVPIK